MNLSMLASQAKAIKEDIARAKGYLSRDQVPRSLSFILKAVESQMRTKIIGKDKYEIGVLLGDFVNMLNAHPVIKQYFKDKGITRTPFIKYVPGKEKLLHAGLQFILNDMQSAETQSEREREEKKKRKKIELIKRSQKLLEAGDHIRAKGYLRRLADSYGHEQGILTDIGLRLLKAELYPEAQEYLSRAIVQFPTDSKAYTLLVKLYIRQEEYAKAENLYLRALRQFGMHPATLLNLAKLYIKWKKLGKAYDTAKQVLNVDKENAEARTIMKKLEKKIFAANYHQKQSQKRATGGQAKKGKKGVMSQIKNAAGSQKKSSDGALISYKK